MTSPAAGDERLPRRFWAKVNVAPDGCWLWTAGKFRDGYAQFKLTHTKNTQGHRVAYERLVGPIPEGLVIDHLCRVRNCVNPAHMEPVTNAENMRRSVPGNSKKTHCPQGHPYDEVNTYLHGRSRHCRLCMAEAARRFDATRRPRRRSVVSS